MASYLQDPSMIFRIFCLVFSVLRSTKALSRVSASVDKSRIQCRKVSAAAGLGSSGGAARLGTDREHSSPRQTEEGDGYREQWSRSLIDNHRS